MKKRIFIGDIHFNFDLYNYKTIFEKIINEINPEEIYFLGDVFNSKKDINYDFIINFKNVIKILFNNNNIKKIRFLLGNHDISYNGENLYEIFDFPEKVKIITDIELEDDILYLPYMNFNSYANIETYLYEIKDYLKNKNKENLIILTHLDICELYNSQTSKNIIYCIELNKFLEITGIKNSKLISGHIHQSKYFKIKNLEVLHIGNFLNTNFNDKNLYTGIIVQEDNNFYYYKSKYNIMFVTVTIEKKSDLKKLFFILSLYGLKKVKIRINYNLDLDYYYHFIEDVMYYYKKIGKVLSYEFEVVFKQNLNNEDINNKDFLSEISDFTSINIEEEFLEEENNIENILKEISPDVNLDILRKYNII